MNWITSAIMRQKRIDPSYYAPEHLATDELIRRASSHLQFEELGSFSRLWSGPFGSKLPSSLYRAEGPYPLYRSQNVKSFWIQEEGLVYLDQDTFDDLKSCSTMPGDILVSKAGFVGTSCIIGDNQGPAIITEHVLGVRPTDDTYPYYLLTTLNSSICRRQLEREGLGTLLDYLGIEVSRELLVPRPATRIQRPIGHKVRAAAILRAAADTFQKHLYNTFPLFLSQSEPINGQWLSAPSFDADRLEAQYYQPHFLEMAAQLSHLECDVVPLGELVSSMRHGASVTGANAVGGRLRFIRGTEIQPNRISTNDVVLLDDATVAELAPAHYLQKRNLLVTRSGTVGMCAVARQQEVGTAFGSFVIAVEFKNGMQPEFVAAFLNSSLGQMQFRREENGAVQMNINNGELAGLRIPLFTEEIQNNVTQYSRSFNENLDRSEELVLSAIADVENLINGTLNESACIRTGQELAQEFDLEMP